MLTENPIASAGNVGLLTALVACAYAVMASVAGARRGEKRLERSGLLASYAATALLSFSSAVMFFLLLSNDYSVKYVQQHSDASMPWIYKLTSFWGGLEGSIVWWALLLSLFSSLALYVNRERHKELLPYVTAVLYTVVGFFLFIIIFEKRPFDLFLTDAPHVGKGLNPLLQNPYMATHPPSLYLGFVSATVPFAFGLAALITGNLDDSWLASTRRWMLVSWYFLSQGLVLGCLWAYEELGWGGYWGWDPVENAGLLPWFTATAFLHSIIVQERRGMMKVWNVSLVIVTFILTMIGTFMTRSGIVQSVHAFGQDNRLAVIFLTFISVTLVFSFGLVIYRLPLLRSRNELDSWLSRDFAFLLNNWVLLSGAFFVLTATLFPTFSEWVTKERITVGPPFFNKWMTPLGLVLLFLTGVGPLIAWRKASPENLREQFTIPIGSASVTYALLKLVLALRAHVGFANAKELVLYVLVPSVDIICFSLCAFVTATITQEFVRGTRVRQSHTKLDFFTSMIGLVARGKRRYGGYLVHMAVVLMFVGFAGGTYKREAEATLEKGKSVAVGPYTVRFDGISQTADSQKVMTTATLTVSNGKTTYATMHPAKWAFRHHEDEPPTTEVDIKKTLAADLYVVLNGYELEPQELANIKVVINPLVNWIWLGFLLLAAGTAIAYAPDRAYAIAARNVPKEASKTIVVLLLLLPGLAFAQNAEQPMAKAMDPAVARSDRERELFKKIVCQCGTCGRQVLADCACGTAADMRRKVQSLIDQGKTDDGVIDYELATYPGQSALVVPLDKGFNRLAWVLPFGAALAGVGALVVMARRWSRTSVKRREQAEPPEVASEDREMNERLADELDELD